MLGGTTEASRLAEALAARRERATLSYAGRTAAPRAQPVPVRIGGFGGVAGLVALLRAEGITHLVDATHPFAAEMSRNAVAACAQSGVPLIALVRPPWRARDGDRWTQVPDPEAAAAALAGPPRRVFLALGRQRLEAFAAQPAHWYLLRIVDPPDTPPPFPRHHVVLARGPFDAESDRALLLAHGVDVVVARNAGGSGAEAKLDAARSLGLPVVLIDRPQAPERREAVEVAEVLAWLDHSAADLGV